MHAPVRRPRATNTPARHDGRGSPFPRALPGKTPRGPLWPVVRPFWATKAAGRKGARKARERGRSPAGPLEPSSKPHQTLACMHTMRSHAPTGGSAWHTPGACHRNAPPPPHTHTALRRRHAQLSPQSTIVHNPSLACAPAWPPNHLSLWPPAPWTSPQGCIGCVPGTTPCQQHTMPPSETAPSSACACCEGTCARATRREPQRRHPARPQAPRGVPRGAPRGAPRRSPWGGPALLPRGGRGRDRWPDKTPRVAPRRSPWAHSLPSAAMSRAPLELHQKAFAHIASVKP